MGLRVGFPVQSGQFGGRRRGPGRPGWARAHSSFDPIAIPNGFGSRCKPIRPHNDSTAPDGDDETLASTCVQQTEDDALMLARLAMATGRTNEALGALARVSDDHPAAAQARLWEGQLELRRHRARAAESSLRRAIAIDPRLVEARRELVYLYGMQRRCDELSAPVRGARRARSHEFRPSVTLVLDPEPRPGIRKKCSRFSRRSCKPTPMTGQSRLALAEAYGSSRTA